MDGFSGSGVAGLQSGFVLAVILLAVFLADRLGGPAQLTKRAFQVALGLGLAFLVLSGTTAFDRPPAVPEELQQSIMSGVSFGDEEDEQTTQLYQDSGRETAQNASEVRTIHVGMGFVLVLGALLLFARLKVIPLAVMLGGLLLLLFGGPQAPGQGLGGLNDIYSMIFSLMTPVLSGGGAGQARDIAYFVVLLVGVVGLAGCGFLVWERAEAGTQSEPAAQSGTL
jgi:hypothetical protein